MLNAMRFAAVLLTLLAIGCGASPDDDSDPKGGPPPPSRFDCTAQGVPERRTPVPIGCATDRGCPERLISGHRSAGGQLGVLAPENTLAAVRAAIAAGADFIETDPRATKDGVLVNLHDTDVDRTTDGKGEAADLTLAQIQALAIDASAFAGDFSCERVPTLHDVLALARGRIHVLLDANKTDRVDLLVQAVHETDTLDFAIFDTDDTAKIQEALTLEPKLHTMIRVTDQAEIDTELALFSEHPPVIVELHDGADPKQLAPGLHAAGHRVLADVFVLDLSAKLDEDSSIYASAFDSGVDIVQTDRPELVAELLKR